MISTTVYMAGWLSCALNLASGNELWQVTAQGNPGNGANAVNAQIINSTLIMVLYGEDDSGITYAHVRALRLADGTTAWDVNLLAG